MTLQEQISADFMTAFKAKDMPKKTFLGLVKGEIQNESSKETFKGDESVLAIVKKMEKSLKEVGDEDSLRELTYIEGYLPQLMGFNELKDVIEYHVELEGLTTMKDMGKVMGFLKSEFGSKYDGKMASTIIKDILG